MSGFITIERRLWDHPFFKDGEMTEREAFMWMIAQAAWKDTSHRVGNSMHPVPRGTFITTLRALQKAFGWRSDKRVRTFLKALEKEAIIGRTVVGETNAPKTHVTICNYNVYQQDGRTKDAPRTHRGRTTDAVKEQGNNKQIESKDSMGLGNSFSKDDFEESWNAIASECGLPEIRKMTPERVEAFRVRQKEYPNIEDWKAAFRCLRKNKWMHGENPKGWIADADFFLQSKSFTKLVEGAYAQAD